MEDGSLIGRTLAGRFKITGNIGEGGMATVYRGEQEAEPNEVAVKVMNPDLAQDRKFVRRFRREAKAAAMLKHPNTVAILEFGVDGDIVYLAMECVNGTDLSFLLAKERRMSEARAVRILIQVCEALTEAHRQTIIHRDLKPDNIMVIPAKNGGEELVKVCDFGIAKILDDHDDAKLLDPRAEPPSSARSLLTRVGTIVGTPAYMSPEQGRAEAVDARTDLYSCGVLLYELITGQTPFDGETPMQVVMRHVNEPPTRPSKWVPMHPGLEAVIMRLLSKYPHERHQSASELSRELNRLLPGLATTARARDGHTGKLATPIPAAGQPARAPQPRPAAGEPAARPKSVPPSEPPTQIRPPNHSDHEAGAPSSDQRTRAYEASFEEPAESAFPTLQLDLPDEGFLDVLGTDGLGGDSSVSDHSAGDHSASDGSRTQRDAGDNGAGYTTRSSSNNGSRETGGAAAVHPLEATRESAQLDLDDDDDDVRTLVASPRSSLPDINHEVSPGPPPAAGARPAAAIAAAAPAAEQPSVDVAKTVRRLADRAAPAADQEPPSDNFVKTVPLKAAIAQARPLITKTEETSAPKKGLTLPHPPQPPPNALASTMMSPEGPDQPSAAQPLSSVVIDKNEASPAAPVRAAPVHLELALDLPSDTSPQSSPASTSPVWRPAAAEVPRKKWVAPAAIMLGVLLGAFVFGVMMVLFAVFR